jgi:hypothetical protein
MLLYIGGNMYFFEDNNFSDSQIEALEDLARQIITNTPEEKSPQCEIWDLDKSCSRFVDAAREKLGIILKRIEISFIIKVDIK